MLTKELIDKFYDDVDSLGLKFPIAALAKATGYNKSNVSLYLSKKVEPSEKFVEAFYEKFPNSSKNVPREKPEEPKANGNDMTEQALFNLTVGNRSLASANDSLAD